MYVGRIVGVGRTPEGRQAVAYRISSRSFPNRAAKQSGRSVQIVPHAGSLDAASDSPYIAYECIVWNDQFAVVSNGTHTRPIFERLKAGNTPRDAILTVLTGLDREFDDYDTPRICGLLDIAENRLWLGSVTAQSLCVTPIAVAAGQMAYITTYEFPMPSSDQLDRSFQETEADRICEHVMKNSVFEQFEKPVCAAAVVVGKDGIQAGTLNPI
jgi:IMP cyclohydrolase